MKNFQLLVVLVFSAFAVQAQEYIPLVKDGAVWNEYKLDTGQCCPGLLYSYLFEYKVAAEIEIQNKTYRKIRFKKLVRYGYNGEDEAPIAVNTLTEGDTIAIREKDKQVYVYDFQEKKEWLLYDFNLKQGDTLPKSYLTPWSRRLRIVREIDSVFLSDGWHKRFSISQDGVNHMLFIIEGIGSQYGLFTELADWKNNRLLCYSENNKSIYSYDTVTKCNWLNTNLPNASFKIVPNPSHGNCYILTESIFGESDICIRDITGKTVLNGKFNHQNSNLNFTNLPKGIYIVELRNGNRSATQKLILQ